jgi:hypothetical protein
METRDWLYVASLVMQALIFGAIFRKAGYSAWLGLLMMVPVVNLAVLVWFATAFWPLEAGSSLRGGGISAKNVNWDLKMALKKAIALEKRGELQEALHQYQHVLSLTGENDPAGETAREQIRSLTAKLGA